MARKKTSPAEDIMDLVAMFPWWVGVVAAFVSYVVLHRMASPPKVVITNPGQVTDLMVTTWFAGIATIGQFILPILCLFGALGSFLKRKKREGLVTLVAAADDPASLRQMSWREFEMLVGEAFRLQGFQVTELGGNGADGGVDLVLRKDTEIHLVQCKQWKAFKVGVTTVRELFGVMAHKGATAGYVVTSGDFTADALSFARGKNLQLIDGPRLFQMIQMARRSMATKQGGAASRRSGPRLVHSVAAPTPAPASSSTPSCPRCTAAMVRRKARKGPNAGSYFWGCSRYPDCFGTA